ncbi:hypothetical protein ASE21_09945 [Flavobacterium sp. Root901]|uniref:hypothetical protein n=1 Tax=Flavobacterium sp. Root901 TaxID=1736605 RepID=UPI00070DB2CE|nr:hypothetical protein [Flavobacterium sp. Root901]KRD10035.1 hypothetical protein ASE21_09945 [Flavobacterium sp. Root901]
MTNEELNLENRKINQENFRNLHSLQYDRIGKLESQENYISSFVTGLSTITIAFSFISETFDSKLKYIVLPLIFSVANIIAILYIQKTRSFIKLHQSRAKKLRETFAENFQALYEEIKKPDSNKDIFNRTNYMSALHLVIAIIGFSIIYYFNFKN